MSFVAFRTIFPALLQFDRLADPHGPREAHHYYRYFVYEKNEHVNEEAIRIVLDFHKMAYASEYADVVPTLEADQFEYLGEWDDLESFSKFAPRASYFRFSITNDVVLAKRMDAGWKPH